MLLKGMNVPGVAWSELLAYTGYPFVLICFTTLGGFLAGVVACLLTPQHRAWSGCVSQTCFPVLFPSDVIPPALGSL